LCVALGALGLAFGFPVESGRGQLDTAQVFQHDTGVGDGHFADGPEVPTRRARRADGGFQWE
jgi:hypothetical protein